jgi:O-antigen ligase
MRLRLASLVLQCGLIAVVLVAIPYKVFELDRYFVPKELVLHVVALGLAILVLARARTLTIDAADALLGIFVAWSALSALFAPSWWLAQRALSLSISSALVFWGARRIAEEGAYRAVLVGAALATGCAAAVGLAQAYGVETVYFSLNRAPGGTFGNRNFVAHFCVIGLPALIFVTVTARTSAGALAGTLGSGAVAALLVLSRTRAAWLAAGVMLAALAFAFLMSRKYWGQQPVGGRLARIALTWAVAIAVVIALPNRLNWRSDSPYLDSALRVVDYSSGSGRGRIAQYLNSGTMALADPLLGAGPGNWSVKYPRVAPRGDASMAADGRTANPWPSSDWVAFVAERGAIAALALACAFAVLFVFALRRWSELGSVEAILARVAGVGTIAATLVVSAFDAVLLLAAPALLAWSVIGATSGFARRGRIVELLGGRRFALVAALVLLPAVGLARSIAQATAINYVGFGGRRAGWLAAADWDPGSYRANLRAARFQAAAKRCVSGRTYARRALALAPDAPEAKAAYRACASR